MNKSIIRLGNIFGTPANPDPMNGRVYSINGVAPTILHGREGGYDQQPKILIQYGETIKF